MGQAWTGSTALPGQIPTRLNTIYLPYIDYCRLSQSIYYRMN